MIKLIRRNSAKRHRLRYKKQVYIALVLFIFCFVIFIISLALFISNKKDTFVITLDSGHGGNDPGAIGYVQETSITEPTITYLKSFLDQDANYSAYITHEPGSNMEVGTRLFKAIANKSDLFISVHANSDGGEGSAKGFEVYLPLPDRKFHKQSVTFANHVVDSIRETDAEIRGNNSLFYLHYYPTGNGEYKKVIEHYGEDITTNYRSFIVLEGQKFPCVLIEQCYVTNQQDIDILGTDNGCREAALKYYFAICSYFKTNPIFDDLGNKINNE